MEDTSKGKGWLAAAGVDSFTRERAGAGEGGNACFVFEEPAQHEAADDDQVQEVRGHPHDQARKLLVLDRAEVRCGGGGGVVRVPRLRREGEERGDEALLEHRRKDEE